MNLIRCLAISVASIIVFTRAARGAGDSDFKNIAPKVAQAVGELLEKAHYSRRQLDDTLSKQLLKNYLERLDYNHLFFTQDDVDGFSAKYATTLDDCIMAGDLDPAAKIFEIYSKRLADRVVKVKALLAGRFDFSGTRSVELKRGKSPWPKDEAEADQIWRDHIEGELLDRTLMDDKLETPVKLVSRRYDQLLRNVHEQTNQDIIAGFLSTLCETYDPHSEYLSGSQLDYFSIGSTHRVGIGMRLGAEEGHAVIRELIPGGSAAETGRLNVGDRITAIAQGDGEFVETVETRLEKVVEMLRGKVDTVVRLRVFPIDSTDPSARNVVEVTRKTVNLKEREAKAELIERRRPDGKMERIGWITLPTFYADMQRTGAKSTTKDTLVLLARLTKENIEGLVIDLRRNGGGSLEEAVNLTGLFIKSGPVVICRDSTGRRLVLRDPDGNVAYDGPMVVLTNKLTASASEIFAAALQDYHRAITVGDHHTFGHGTVSTMVELGNIIPRSLSGRGTGNEAGALKLTIQKFYRVDGSTIQLQGVASDIILPSLWDQTAIGEMALRDPLLNDEIGPVEYEKMADRPGLIEKLRERSAARVSVDPEFTYIREDNASAKRRMAENRVSLNEKVRREEIAMEQAREKARTAARAERRVVEPKVYSLALDDVDKPLLEKTRETKAPPAHSYSSKRDSVRDETLRILADLIELWPAQKARRGAP